MARLGYLICWDMFAVLRYTTMATVASRAACAALAASAALTAAAAPGRRAASGFGRGPHDVGGAIVSPDEATAFKAELGKEGAPAALWEVRTHALLGLVVGKGLMTVDELRAGIEGLDPVAYGGLSYYEKWAFSMAQALTARGTLSPTVLETAINGDVVRGDEIDSAPVPLSVGQPVRVRREEPRPAWSRPHLRTPGYLHGAVGVVDEYWGEFPDPELLARRIEGPKLPLYSVRFLQAVLWELYDGSPHDATSVEVYHPWLEPISSEALATAEAAAVASMNKVHGSGRSHHDHAHDHAHAHDHDHDHDHVHEERCVVESNAIAAESEHALGEGNSPLQRLSGALVEALVDSGLVSRDEVRAKIESVEKMSESGSEVGARLVVEAWLDDQFRELLVADAPAAAEAIGIETSNYGKATGATVLRVVENTEMVHNLVVCTLCSCYPTTLLGLSPAWYKSRTYRARAVREPRALLAEFGTRIPDEVAVKVHDSTADLRYMVLPLRPEGTEGWSREALLGAVTRDAMIGVTR
ncbi:nitrile hydratase [Thecamonas trahens ATCC 50062]|uniref:nitrile hydratase n=1 Tax=Thecamonas trahens ATCC 50062 TaxID=461836 RepID=A0A0L0DIB0_THETB|nr:nitrile hydratase [Thecamonas trahens ATCC 50062]KNC51841.1 nitrile hydratase [Thecamonas trahens ATCC 50062]|eukprot:XP_013755706.1 nitrile hydratase [Thecamonas trahens ATCC 50062]